MRSHHQESITVSACSMPPHLRTQASGKDKMFQPILEKIDKAFPDRPVFVFGYSQLMRGLSCAFSLHYALYLHLTSLFSRRSSGIGQTSACHRITFCCTVARCQTAASCRPPAALRASKQPRC